MADQTVTMYTTPTCAFCHAAKEFFNEHDIDFTEHDVAKDAEKRQEMIDQSGQLGVPVITIDGKTVVGFDRNKLEELLGITS